MDSDFAPMTQSRKASAIEAATQTVLGFWIALGVADQMYRYLDIPVSHGQNALIGLVLVGASFFRQFLIRRFFEAFR